MGCGNVCFQSGWHGVQSVWIYSAVRLRCGFGQHHSAGCCLLLLLVLVLLLLQVS
jgi:hypothetical protein